MDLDLGLGIPGIDSFILRQREPPVISVVFGKVALDEQTERRSGGQVN